MALDKPKGLNASNEFTLRCPGRNAVVTPNSKSQITILRVTTLTLAAALTYFILWSISFFDISGHSVEISETKPSNPADKWLDDDWPYHEQEPWDISTDFAYPRVLEYEVNEGTWMRLDVHPKTGEIVFDLLGDIYCLTPGSSRAHPILLGIPHDSDPHFSPDGDRLVFRSDAELGVDNIWVIPWKSCNAGAVRPDRDLEQHGVYLGVELAAALTFQIEDEMMLSNGIRESTFQKRRRLLREGRLHAHRVTNETYRFVTDARFHPSGNTVVACKWYTSSRTIPAGEGWQYDVPDVSNLYRSGDNVTQVRVGDGKRVVSRNLAVGWSPEQYPDQQIGSEQFIWRSTDTIIYSKKPYLEHLGIFEYSSDVHSGIHGIYSLNLTTGETETLVDPFPGGASRPELSRDGTTLAFVRRVRDKEALALLDMQSGSLHYVWYGLTYDLTSIPPPMGTYPSFAFTPNDDGIIIWAAGKLWRIPLLINFRGEKVSGGDPISIPFKAKVEKRLAATLRPSTNLVATETADSQRVYSFKELSVDDTGKNVLFQAAGMTYMQKVGSFSPPVPIPVLDHSATYYSPSFVPGFPNLVLHSKWSETNFTTFELADVHAGEVYDLSKGLPFGRYTSPILSDCNSPNRKMAFVRLAGDTLTGDVLATAGAGIMVADVTLPYSGSDDKEHLSSRNIRLRNLQSIPSWINLSDTNLRLKFVDNGTKLLVEDLGRSFLLDLEAGPDRSGKHKQKTLVTAKTGTEVTVASVTTSSSSITVSYTAFVDFMQVFLVNGEQATRGPLQSKPGKATPGLRQVSVDGGHDIKWSGDGKKLFWLLGPYLHSIDVASLLDNRVLPTIQEIVVGYDSDITRLKSDGRAAALATHPVPDLADVEHSDVIAITNATLLTFDTGHFSKDLVPNGVLVAKAGVITQVGVAGEVHIPQGAHVIDASEGLLTPGFIDVHAHWNGFSVQLPTRSWELETFLAYGVTTLHNPSSDNRDGYHERFLVESGKSIGPRIYHTGGVIYGGAMPNLHQSIANMGEARSALVRIKAEGGPSSFSYKNYQLPSRASRQRLLLAARELSMLCVPEGGMNYDWDLTYIVDGMTTIEHAIPIPVLYDDVLTLYSQSGTASTPTHIVNYGGVMGEQLVWGTVDVPNDPKLRRLTRHDILEGLSETTKRPRDSFALFNTSASVAELVNRGAFANIGAHGEPPLGLMYHAEMKFALAGGLNAYEVLRAATRDGALSLGLFDSIGSLSPGKLADLVLYPKGVGFEQFHDLRPTQHPRFVVRGGRVFEANTMIEEWPVKGRKHVLPRFNAD